MSTTTFTIDDDYEDDDTIDEDDAQSHDDTWWNNITPDAIRDGSQTLNHDGYDVQVFNEIRRKFPKLEEVIQLGQQRLATATALIRDIWWSFYKRAPLLTPIVPLTEAHKINHSILESIMVTKEWNAVRLAGAVGDQLNATLATMGVAASAIAAIDDATVHQINTLSELESGARELWNEAQALESLIEQAAGKATEELYLRADNARRAWRAKQQEIAAIAVVIEEHADDVADNARRASRTAMRAAEQSIQELEEIAEVFSELDDNGDSPVQRMNIKDKIELARRVQQSPRLKQIIAISGRSREIALQVQATKVVRDPDEIVGITFGNDLSKVMPDELAFIGDPDLEIIFWVKYLEEGLMMEDLIGNEKQGQGPIIFVIDSSGSMSQTIQGVSKEVWAKSVVIGGLAIARKQKRDVCVIQFGTTIKVWHFPKGYAPHEALVTCMEYFMNASSEYYHLWMEEVQNIATQASFKKADVICIADGLSTIRPATVSAWNNARQQLEMRVYSILIGSGAGVGVLSSISDAVMTIDDLQQDTAVLQTVFSV